MYSCEKCSKHLVFQMLKSFGAANTFLVASCLKHKVFLVMRATEKCPTPIIAGSFVSLSKFEMIKE